MSPISHFMMGHMPNRFPGALQAGTGFTDIERGDETFGAPTIVLGR